MKPNGPVNTFRCFYEFELFLVEDLTRNDSSILKVWQKLKDFQFLVYKQYHLYDPIFCEVRFYLFHQKDVPTQCSKPWNAYHDHGKIMAR